MKPSDVDALAAGQDLDALIEEKVMGRHVELVDKTPMWVGTDLPGSPYVLKDGRFGHSIQPYSTEIHEAWKVLEKMRAYRREPGRFADPTPIFTLFVIAMDQDARPKTSHGTTLYDVLVAIDPAMICRAALKAMLWSEQEAKKASKVKA